MSKLILLLPALALAFGVMAKDGPKEIFTDPTDKPADNTPLQFSVKDIDGKDVNLADFKGKVVLIVNVASRCGNTPQYKPMEEMYEKYKDQGLVIIGFPENNFLSQEPGSDAQIKEFCESTYHVSFPMMSKIDVKGDKKAPLYKYLTEAKTNGPFAGEIDWNFNKFLVDRNGAVIARIAPGTKPNSPKVIAEIEKALAAPAAK